MYIAIDIGGTNTRVASSKDLKKFHLVEKFETADTLEAQKPTITQAIDKVLAGSDYSEVKGICVGVPGIVDKKSNKFAQIVNAPYLSNLPINSIFEKEFPNAAVFGENDAAMAALGEAVYGAGKDYETVAYLTISTGIGGARISNKKYNTTQKFSEPGHHIINVGGDLDTKVNLQGTFEAYVSGQAFEREFGISPKNSDDPHIWEMYGQRLAYGMINICAFWAPDVIVIGGGISNRFDSFVDALKTNFKKQDFFEMPEFKKSELGDDSGLYGCLSFLEQEL